MKGVPVIPAGPFVETAQDVENAEVRLLLAAPAPLYLNVVLT